MGGAKAFRLYIAFNVCSCVLKAKGACAVMLFTNHSLQLIRTYYVWVCRYVRCLGAVYLRLVGETLEVYNYLEPLYNDYRKIKRKNRNGGT